MLRFQIITVALASTLFGMTSNGDPKVFSSFAAGKNCVAWQASKRMFLIDSQYPVGKTCQVEIKFQKNGDQRVVEVTVPISSFDSGEKERDQEVAKLLLADQFPYIKIVTQPFSSQEIEVFKSGSLVELPGRLEFAGRSIEKTFQVRKADNPNGAAHVVVQTTFTELGLQAPKVAGGLVAKVRDELKLYGQLLINEALN